MNTNTSPKRTSADTATVRKFGTIANGTQFRIHSEPSRGLRFVSDKTIYTKVSDAYSSSNIGRPDIILMPEDLVQVLREPQRAGAVRR